MEIKIEVKDGEHHYKKESLSFESAEEDLYKIQRVVEARRDKEFQALPKEDFEKEFVYPDDYYPGGADLVAEEICGL